MCPYYGARRAVPSADVLLVPYSAVLQPDTRRSLGIELEGSVVVFDEAHNLLDAINGAHSAAVTGAPTLLTLLMLLTLLTLLTLLQARPRGCAQPAGCALACEQRRRLTSLHGCRARPQRSSWRRAWPSWRAISTATRRGSAPATRRSCSSCGAWPAPCSSA